MSRHPLDDAFQHNTWATIRIIDACAELAPDQLAASVVGGRGSIIETLRHIVGSAGVGGLPALQQELGLGVALGPLRGDVVVNASSGHTRGGLGFALVP